RIFPWRQLCRGRKEGRMNWVRTFQLATAGLAVIAVYLTVTDPRSDYLFAAVILTICAGFLAYRFQLKERLPERPSRGRWDRSASDTDDEAE
ncbi:MAG TPA: hypothetical protein VL501_04415, partial [Pyrinomonadaceae bacterium]|nr:hypothetical protein [Pyrinomonadaceae bacterium]